MIKTDYEGAWKEMKEYLGLAPGVYMFRMALVKMKELEQKHTMDFIDIKKCSDKGGDLICGGGL